MGRPDHVRGRPDGTGALGPLLDGWPGTWRVHHVDQTGSTNLDLVHAADDGAPDRTVLVTDHQTAGRGRLDRRWDAPPGDNLLVSLLFRRDLPIDPSELTRRVGLAVVDAVRSVAGIEAGLKWPNDVLVDEGKLAGILAHRCGDGSVVVGLGLNVRWAPEGAACLGSSVEPLAVLRTLLDAYDELPRDIDRAYRSALLTLGRRVRIELADGEIVGTATDVERDGRLVVIDECAITHRVSVGDVVHLRPG